MRETKTTKTLRPNQYLDRKGNVRTRAIRHSLAQRNPTTGMPRKRMSVGRAQRARTLRNAR